MRWKLLDRIVELEPGRRALGVWGVSYDAATLERPDARAATLPRVLVLESIGQLASWLVIASTGFARRPVMGSFDRAVFARDLFPGERVTVEAELHRLYDTAGLVSGRALVDGEVVAEVARATCGLLPLEELEDPDEVRAELLELRGGPS
jgi:3-hydroxyacyl-[acyl-carrier-protein] dehydratase